MENMMHCWGCGKDIHTTATTCPHCGADQNRSKTGKPWGTGRTIFYAIFSLLIPIAGLGAGIQGLLSSGKRKQGALLLILGIIGALAYVAVAMMPRYVQPGEQFLRSELMVRPGISEVGLSVGQFVEVLEKAVMDNGKNPQVNGWTREARRAEIYAYASTSAEWSSVVARTHSRGLGAIVRVAICHERRCNGAMSRNLLNG